MKFGTVQALLLFLHSHSPLLPLPPPRRLPCSPKRLHPPPPSCYVEALPILMYFPLLVAPKIPSPVSLNCLALSLQQTQRSITWREISLKEHEKRPLETLLARVGLTDMQLLK